MESCDPERHDSFLQDFCACRETEINRAALEDIPGFSGAERIRSKKYPDLLSVDIPIRKTTPSLFLAPL